jgi:hypothetical protein
MAMQQLAISNDWLPIDRWIAEALDQSIPTSQIESDLVDCLLFWSGKYSKKGASSRDSLAKSLEAVRILVSLGIEQTADLQGGGGAPPSRLREFFKIPFARLKALESGTRIEAILGLDAGAKALAAYWNSESKQRIDTRLYAMVRGNFETAAALAILEKEFQSILRRLIRISGIPCPPDETRALDPVEIHSLIRTLLAMHLNRIKRPSPRRKAADLADSHFNGFEPLSQEELAKIRANGSQTGDRKTEIDRQFTELMEQLAVSDEAMAEICGSQQVSWTAYIAGLRDLEHHFACEEATLLDPFEEDEETRRTLESVFSEPLTEYSRKDLEMRRNAMPKNELDQLLKTGEKMGVVSIRKEGSRKFYRLEPAASDEA